MSINNILKFSNKINLLLEIPSSRVKLKELKSYLQSEYAQLFTKNTCKELCLITDEILQNAYEHGNLEISDEEKKKFLDNATLEEEFTKREEMFKNRLIKLELTLDENNFMIKVEDQGKGFEHENILKEKMNNLKNRGSESTGHGIPLLLKLGDSLEYSSGGRVCSLSKKISH